MKWAVIYSSVTGNTKKLAEAAAKGLNADIFPVNNIPDLSSYDALFIGYWLRRGSPDDKTSAFLKTLSNRKIVFFQTHGAYVGSEHTVTAFARAGALLGEECIVLGTFSCQCAVSPSMIKARKEGKIPGHKNDNLDECLKRWKNAKSHPDEKDLEAIQNFAKKMQIVAQRDIINK